MCFVVQSGLAGLGGSSRAGCELLSSCAASLTPSPPPPNSPPHPQPPPPMQDVGAAVVKRPSLLGLDLANLEKIVGYLKSVDTPPETIVKYMLTSI
jgi:hypothetical protein